MKNILIVGGAGYVGSHMVLALQDAGYHIVVFDNLSRGFADAVGVATFIRGDLLSITDLDACFSKNSFDLVMHFAALAYVGESVVDPEMYYRNNVTGTLNLLATMRRYGVKRLVFSSSCATYGEPDYIPIDENHPQRPTNPYGWSKFMVEKALSDYAAANFIKSISLRYFNAAGCDSQGRAHERHLPETHLIPLALLEALRLKQGGKASETALQVYGSDLPTKDGSCIRDYVHVTDLCNAHLCAAERLLADLVVGAEAYNLANGAGYSVFEVIDVCRKVTGQPLQYRLMPRRQGDPAVLVGDAGRAREIFNWRPTYVNLPEIIGSAWNVMVRQ